MHFKENPSLPFDQTSTSVIFSEVQPFSALTETGGRQSLLVRPLRFQPTQIEIRRRKERVGLKVATSTFKSKYGDSRKVVS